MAQTAEIEIWRMDPKEAVTFYGSAPRWDLIVKGKGELGLTRTQLLERLQAIILSREA